MRRNVVLSTYNGAIHLDQIQSNVWEKHVAKRFICTWDLSHVQTLLHVWACVLAIACLS